MGMGKITALASHPRWIALGGTSGRLSIWTPGAAPLLVTELENNGRAVSLLSIGCDRTFYSLSDGSLWSWSLAEGKRLLMHGSSDIAEHPTGHRNGSVHAWNLVDDLKSGWACLAHHEKIDALRLEKEYCIAYPKMEEVSESGAYPIPRSSSATCLFPLMVSAASPH